MTPHLFLQRRWIGIAAAIISLALPLAPAVKAASSSSSGGAANAAGSSAVIFDKDHTDGWKYLGDGEMIVQDGVASTMDKNPSKDGIYWYQKSTFADFTLTLEFKVDTTTANSGVFVRFPDPGGNYHVASDKGYEVDIYGDKTGSIIYPVSDKKQSKARPTAPVPLLLGDWNDLEITAIGTKITVKVNGQAVNEFTEANVPGGYIALQTHTGDGAAHFRNIRIKPQAAAPTAPVTVAKTEPKIWENNYWPGDISIPAGNYEVVDEKIQTAKDLKISVGPDSLIDGGTFNSLGGVVWEARQSLFRNTHLEEMLGARFVATSCLFDRVEMYKGGGWFTNKWSTRWDFENCVFASKFTRKEINVTDYSIRANRCTFYNLTLPRYKFKADPSEEAQSNDLKFSNCRFVHCEVPEAFLALTIDSAFDGCTFPDKREDWSKAGQPITVTAYITGAGEAPKSYENGNLKVTFKTTEAPDNGSNLPYSYKNGSLSLGSIPAEGKKLKIGAVDNKPPATPAPAK